MDKQNARAAERWKKIERSDFFTATGGKSRMGLQKKWNVRAERSRQFGQLRFGYRSAKKFIQGEERDGRVAAAPAQTGSNRNFFFQMNSNTFADARRF